jgi:hypothetical protein
MQFDCDSKLIPFTDANIEKLRPLVEESLQEGYQFLQRTDDWYDRTKRFDKAGGGFRTWDFS